MAATTTKPSSTPNAPFLRTLTSSRRSDRLTALHQLRAFLSSQPASSPLSPVENLKLWKALVYALWMQDKPLHQQNLSLELAGLVEVVKGAEGKVRWMRAFWASMKSFWPEIDSLRVDKFLFLVRAVVGAGWAECARDSWRGDEGGFLRGWVEALGEIPLSSSDQKVGNGMRFHVLDVYLDELEKVDAGHEAPMEVLLEPVRRLREEGRDKVVRKRAGEVLGDERLGEWGVQSEVVNRKASAAGAEDGEDAEFGGFDD